MVTEKPLVVVVMPERFTTNPALVSLAVPALELAEVAANAALTVAVAVAEALTTRMSVPKRSVMVSVPAATAKVEPPVAGN